MKSKPNATLAAAERKSAVVTVALTTAIAVSMVVPPKANPITYELVGVTETYGTRGTDTVSGNFTYDPTSNTLISIDLTITGPLARYEVGAQTPGFSDVVQAFFLFSSFLGDVPDDLRIADLNDASGGGISYESTAVTGYANPISSVPGPIVWRWSARPTRGMGWPSRVVPTEEDRLNVGERTPFVRIATMARHFGICRRRLVHLETITLAPPKLRLRARAQRGCEFGSI
jgi:hypothetical protein